MSFIVIRIGESVCISFNFISNIIVITILFKIERIIYLRTILKIHLCLNFAFCFLRNVEINIIYYCNDLKMVYTHIHTEFVKINFSAF